MSGVLLDTTVLVDITRGKHEAADFVESVRDSDTPICVSVISAMELIAGCRDGKEAVKSARLIDSFDLVHLSPGASTRAYDFTLSHSRSHGLSIPDALIAATAVAQELELAPDNDRHFCMIAGLAVRRPY